jgi:hypothetical protein
MRIHRIATPLILAIALPAVGQAGPIHAAAPRATCTKAGYSISSNAVCVQVPSSGSFSVKVPETSLKVKGKGSAATHATQITITKLAAPVKSKGGVGIKIRATGKFNPLHVSSGTLWLYNAGKNSLKQVSTITKNGIYQDTK